MKTPTRFEVETLLMYRNDRQVIYGNKMIARLNAARRLTEKGYLMRLRSSYFVLTKKGEEYLQSLERSYAEDAPHDIERYKNQWPPKEE